MVMTTPKYAVKGADEMRSFHRMLHALRNTFVHPGSAGRPLLGLPGGPGETGQYANVLDLGPGFEFGLAIATDGVGTKILAAEIVGKFDTIGIDCVAMNVNDII